MVNRFVRKYDETFSMNVLQDRDTIFGNFPYALEAVDVTFQQANRPSGKMQEGKRYSSGKHKLYGFKVEVSARPNGIASSFSSHYPGSVSDLSIIHERIELCKSRLKKREEDANYQDEFMLAEKYPNQWAVLMDKGYQGAAGVLRAITPRKKPVRGFLDRDDEVFNKKLSTDRILAENYFGRLGQLWSVLSKKYVWSEKYYNLSFSYGVALTNIHIIMHKLRDDDGSWYNRYHHLIDVGETTKKKHARSQSKYRQKRKARLSIGCRSIILRSVEETQDPELYSCSHVTESIS